MSFISGLSKVEAFQQSLYLHDFGFWLAELDGAVLHILHLFVLQGPQCLYEVFPDISPDLFPLRVQPALQSSCQPTLLFSHIQKLEVRAPIVLPELFLLSVLGSALLAASFVFIQASAGVPPGRFNLTTYIYRVS